MLKKVQFLIFSLVIFLVSVIIIKSLVPDYHLDGGINLKSYREEILEKSKQIYKSVSSENHLDNYRLSLKRNSTLIKSLRDSLKFNEANQSLRANEFSYFWEAEFTGDKKENTIISGTLLSLNQETIITLN